MKIKPVYSSASYPSCTPVARSSNYSISSWMSRCRFDITKDIIQFKVTSTRDSHRWKADSQKQGSQFDVLAHALMPFAHRGNKTRKLPQPSHGHRQTTPILKSLLHKVTNEEPVPTINESIEKLPHDEPTSRYKQIPSPEIKFVSVTIMIRQPPGTLLRMVAMENKD